MARATHLTISTADRIRLDGRCGEVNQDREDEDGENEVRQEVQVSVTFALDPGDTDLVRLAEAKALEVKLAHEAVWNRIGAFSTNAFSGSDSSSGRCNGSGISSGRHAADEDRNGKEDERDDPDDDPLAGLPHHGDDPFSGGPSAGGASRPHPAALTGQDNPFPTKSVVPSHNGHPAPPGNGTGDADSGPEPDTDPVTGPQKILIRSRAGKIGLTAYALESLLYQQFKVWRVERLTKEQAASVLAALERDLKEKKGSAHETEYIAR